MQTHYSVTHDNGIDQAVCIINKCRSIHVAHSHCGNHAGLVGKSLNTTAHHYFITEWDDEDNIINQTNLEEALHDKV